MTWTDLTLVMMAGFSAGLTIWGVGVFFGYVTKFIREGINPDEH